MTRLCKCTLALLYKAVVGKLLSLVAPTFYSGILATLNDGSVRRVWLDSSMRSRTGIFCINIIYIFITSNNEISFSPNGTNQSQRIVPDTSLSVFYVSL